MFEIQFWTIFGTAPLFYGYMYDVVYKVRFDWFWANIYFKILWSITSLLLIIDEQINSHCLESSLDNQNIINAHLMHKLLPMDACVNISVDKIINHLIKLSETLPSR